MRKVGFKVVKE